MPNLEEIYHQLNQVLHGVRAIMENLAYIDQKEGHGQDDLFTPHWTFHQLVLVPLDEYEHLVEDANRWAHRPVEPQEPVRTICDCSDCQRRAY